MAPTRERVRFADAVLVRGRVLGAADALGLRGARAATLGAVLELLCGWSRLDDERISLDQISDIIDTAGRGYDRKTLGRALCWLAGAALIVYRPARGRGTRARVAIHPRFTDDIAVLARDQSTGRIITTTAAPRTPPTAAPSNPTTEQHGDQHGDQHAPQPRSANPQSHQDRPQESVSHPGASPGFVTFYPPLSLYRSQRIYPPTPHGAHNPPPRRPSAVNIDSGELRTILATLPPAFQGLPTRLRWLLGRIIAGRLRAGWTPTQILTTLAAPTPDTGVHRPLKLAQWRLCHNMPGAGPRLAPLQRAHDQHHTKTQRDAHRQRITAAYTQVCAATTAAERARILDADTATYQRRSRSPMAALAHAARKATTMYPQLELGHALTAWADHILDPPTTPANPTASSSGEAHIHHCQTPQPRWPHTPPNTAPDLVTELAIDAHCVICGTGQATARKALPLASMVCDRCWPHIAADLTADSQQPISG